MPTSRNSLSEIIRVNPQNRNSPSMNNGLPPQERVVALRGGPWVLEIGEMLRDALALVAGIGEQCQWEDKCDGADDPVHAGWSTWRDGGHHNGRDHSPPELEYPKRLLPERERSEWSLPEPEEPKMTSPEHERSERCLSKLEVAKAENTENLMGSLTRL
ncbi:hypothetical protein F5887DRAFT_1178551 [Amanita rubescens]|nr:hypothetical protein F5887DRAFT_1178551 [Amanita rubescens]